MVRGYLTYGRYEDTRKPTGGGLLEAGGEPADQSMFLGSPAQAQGDRRSGHGIISTTTASRDGFACSTGPACGCERASGRGFAHFRCTKTEPTQEAGQHLPELGP
eukprot:5073729-Prymnesium_polylepis.1